ncbi:hypothetical protein TSUD_39350 [Trifolium subterraneum]|uniref:RING-type E3 ubiquitin transferase n=1 Tax=Trifolium subterraneum TaxID=3900 RepID=A0A2Z6MFU7_TRISU|nr:hypothetical protein TSUD_39350 [Trifolium subterraneum]
MSMVPWHGISCCLSAAALYLLGRDSGRDVDFLKSVIRVNQLKELEQHFLKHNDAGSWIQDSASMLSMSKEVPWYLEDGTDHVRVFGARGATGFVLPVGSEAFEQSGLDLERGTLDYLQGLKVTRDDVGTIRIQRPLKGPFFVSHKTIDELIANLGKWASWYKCASVGLTALGVYMIANHAIRYILERRRRSEFQKRILAAAAKRSGQDNGGEKDDILSDSAKRESAMPNLCVICLEQEYNSVFVPCGHMCCCTACSSHLTSCPLCRRQIEKAVKTFRH